MASPYSHVKRAKKELNVEAVKGRGSTHGKWLWSLPAARQRHETSEGDQRGRWSCWSSWAPWVSSKGPPRGPHRGNYLIYSRKGPKETKKPPSGPF